MSFLSGGSNYQTFALNVIYPHSLVTVMIEIEGKPVRL